MLQSEIKRCSIYCSVQFCIDLPPPNMTKMFPFSPRSLRTVFRSRHVKLIWEDVRVEFQKNTSSVLALTSSRAFCSASHFFFLNNDAFQLQDKGVLDMCQAEFIMAAIGGERNFTTFPSFDADTSSSWFRYLANNSKSKSISHVCINLCKFRSDSAV